jgi:hypothetical protein
MKKVLILFITFCLFIFGYSSWTYGCGIVYNGCKWRKVGNGFRDAANPGTTMIGFESTIPANTNASLTVLLLPEGAQENSSLTSKKITEWPKTN